MQRKAFPANAESWEVQGPLCHVPAVPPWHLHQRYPGSEWSVYQGAQTQPVLVVTEVTTEI